MEKLGGSPILPSLPEGSQDTSKKGLKTGEDIDHKIAELKGKLSESKGSSIGSKINWFVNKIGIGSLGREIVSSKLEKAHVKLLNATGRAQTQAASQKSVPSAEPEKAPAAEPERRHPLPPHLRPVPAPPPRDDNFHLNLPTSAVKTAQLLSKKQQEKRVIHTIIVGMESIQKNSDADLKMRKGILAEVEGEINALEKHLEALVNQNAPPPPPPERE